MTQSLWSAAGNEGTYWGAFALPRVTGRAMFLPMAAGQQTLFAEEQPLVKRLGRKFFLKLPRRPGVYLMRDAQENILYVGKAKDLRQRLGSYRNANDAHLGRRRHRLLRQVARIELKVCRDESAALAKEAELIRSVRPKFNRAGVWPVKPRCLLWRVTGDRVSFKLSDVGEPGWRCVGPLKGMRWVRMTLARLVWFASHAQTGVSGLPAGWLENHLPEEADIDHVPGATGLIAALDALSISGAQPLENWVRLQVGAAAGFDAAWLEAELESLGQVRFDRIGHASPTAQVKDEQRLFAFA